MLARHAAGVLGTPYSRAKSGYRPGLGDNYFRSSWEANYARFLNLMIRMKIVEKWEFEPETFWFLDIKRGTRSYLPDFRVKYANEAAPVYVEVKGYFDAKSKTKIKRFRKYYPQHRLELVDAKAYRKIEQQFGRSITGWE